MLHCILLADVVDELDLNAIYHLLFFHLQHPRAGSGSPPWCTGWGIEVSKAITCF